MITPEDIKVEKRPCDLREGFVEVRSVLKLTCQHICNDDGEEISYHEMQSRREIWQSLYGELAEDIERLRAAILPHTLAYAQHSAMQEFDKIAKKLRDPFVGQINPSPVSI